MPLMVRCANTFADIKICAAGLGIPPEQQELTFADTILETHCTVGPYSFIGAGCDVSLVRLCSGICRAYCFITYKASTSTFS